MTIDRDKLPRTRKEAKLMGSKHFFTGTPCKYGHIDIRSTISGACAECPRKKSREYRERNIEKVTEKVRKWREENKEWMAAYSKQYRENDKEGHKERWRAWHLKNKDEHNKKRRKERSENPEKHKERTRAWKFNNPEAYKESYTKSYRKQRSTPKGKLEHAISSGVRRGLLKGAKAGRKTFDLLGYSLDDLRAHLESKFLPGMSWDNYGDGGWEIDHEVPRSAHNYQTPDDIDFKRCWALSNLRPMWLSDNRSKGDKLLKPFQPSLPLAVNDNKPREAAA